MQDKVTQKRPETGRFLHFMQYSKLALGWAGGETVEYRAEALVEAVPCVEHGAFVFIAGVDLAAPGVDKKLRVHIYIAANAVRAEFEPCLRRFLVPPQILDPYVIRLFHIVRSSERLSSRQAVEGKQIVRKGQSVARVDLYRVQVSPVRIAQKLPVLLGEFVFISVGEKLLDELVAQPDKQHVPALRNFARAEQQRTVFAGDAVAGKLRFQALQPLGVAGVRRCRLPAE